MLKEKLLNISKSLFYLLVFLIPVNLGKHFELIESYVWGILTDYLIPTIYVQDILIILIVIFWILGGGLKKISKNNFKILERKELQISSLLIFSILLSTFTSARFIPSIYAWVRIFLYFLLFIYILVEIPVEDHFFRILNTLAISVIFLSVLGIAQYLNRGSVFNNYLVLGEQPYSEATFDVTRKMFLGKTVIPSYGLFRHPNIFAGFLTLTLVWLFTFIKKSKLYSISFILGIISLAFTFSYISWIVFIFGVFLHLYLSKNPKYIKNKKRNITVAVYLVCALISIIPIFKFLSKIDDPSILRRYNFSRASYRMIKDHFLFGVGFNNSTIFMDEYNYETRDIRFTQPVHNIFLLIFSETGIFSFILFLLFIYFSGNKLINSSYFHLFLISFLQILLIGSLDHYFITIHQTLLTFWLFMGLALQ
ncbi:O-antigen ligase family protein [Patescibacteria group bacterium]|nr:O-antigen ligase family protein [Patescibacteria group bacterium]